MALPKDVQEQWSNPSNTYRSAPFWSWNAKLDPDRLCRAIESMHDAGMGGFFIHSRGGLKTPYMGDEWFTCVSACVEKARELGMKAYLYDEDRWPSGAGGGMATRDHMEFRNHSIRVTKTAEESDPESRIAAFTIELDDTGRIMKNYAATDNVEQSNTWVFDLQIAGDSGWYNDGGYLDTMNQEAVAEFIRTTHQAYSDHYQKDFGDLIPAIFTDEPNIGRGGDPDESGAPILHWTRDLPREFQQRRGYDLCEHLPELIFTTEPWEFSKVRYDYYRTLTELFTENFSKQIGDWCEEHNIALTGHVLGEGSLGQIRTVGAVMPHYEHMQWPGIDILCDGCGELLTPKQCSSVADQLGKQRVLSELYGCTGWDWPLEGHKFVGDWQYALGVNFRCQHLTHYSLAGAAKRDYPASIFSHSPWWPYYHVVEDYFARLSMMLTQGTPIRDILIIHPIESLWGLRAVVPNLAKLSVIEKTLKQITPLLTGEHYDWDFGDESLLAKHGKVSGDALTVGQMNYKMVIVPPTVNLRKTTVELLKQFIAAGGKVLFVDRQPTHVDGCKNADIADVVASAIACDEDAILATIESLLPRRVSITDESGAEQHDMFAMLRDISDGQMLFIRSHDRQKSRHLHVRVAGQSPVVNWDPMTSEKYDVPATTKDGHVTFDLDLPPTGSALLTLGATVPDTNPTPKPATVQKTIEFNGPFDIECTEPNTLSLDHCRYRIADGEWSDLKPVLKVGAEIRKHYGLVNGAHQPWYLYAMGVEDTSPRDPMQMKWTFHVTQRPDKCLLALENPEDYTITVNGKPVSDVVGWWVDEDIKTLDITDLLIEGENELLWDFVYRADMELEDAYLVGNFGIANQADGPYLPGTATLVTPPTQLKLGSWVEQGLPFYGSAVKYRLTVEKPAEKGRLRISLPEVRCTAAVVHVGDQQFVMPWAPFTVDITDALADGENEIFIEVVGGRKNILGPLHTPWGTWTGPGQFGPGSKDWTEEYLFNDHGLMQPVRVEIVE